MTSFSNSSSTTRKVLEFADWNPKAHKYMAPKVNSMGGKSVTLISTQSSRSLHLNTPLLMTWGIADFANDDGTSDGKFKLSLNFPNAEYTNKDSDLFLQKLVDFQAQVIDDAVTNSEIWFGKKKSKELVEDSFFPFLKYPKVKDATGKSTGATDYSRPPSISAKVPCYKQDDGSLKWECDIFDINYSQIFPSEDEDVTPVDLVPKLSKIACTIQCSGIWIGGKGWGLTWKFISGVVKPKISETVRGTCHIPRNIAGLHDDQPTTNEAVEEDEPVKAAPKVEVQKQPISTTVDDSDDEDAQIHPSEVQDEAPPKIEVAPAATPEPAPTPVASAEPPKIVKKVVKKKVVA